MKRIRRPFEWRKMSVQSRDWYFVYKSIGCSSDSRCKPIPRNTLLEKRTKAKGEPR